MPEWATKERREKVLDLLPEECDLIREQRLVRSPNTVVGFEGSLLLFPRPGGTPWRYHSSFWNRVIVPTRTKEATAWREEHGTTANAPTPFDNFKPRDLRRGASTLMRELGISPELAASRLGHKDAGHLLVTVYAETRRENLRAELQAIAAEGGIDARLASRRLS